MNAEKLEKIVVQCLEAACAFKKPVANVKIVSGGQTGVDRGVLEAATALGLDFGGWSPHGWIAEDGTISWGVIVPHRNRTRVLGGLLCAFYNGRDARCASCGRDARHPDNGQDARCPCCAAKMAAFPVRARQARPLPWRRSRGSAPLPVAPPRWRRSQLGLPSPPGWRRSQSTPLSRQCRSLPSQEIIQNTRENVISRQKRC